MERNVAGNFTLFAYDYATGAPKTGIAANIVPYLGNSNAGFAPIALGNATMAELNANNAPGWYRGALTAAERNYEEIQITGNVNVANVALVGQRITLTPPNFSLNSVDGSGRVLLQPAQGNITGNITGTLTGSVTGNVGAVTGNVGGSLGGNIGGQFSDLQLLGIIDQGTAANVSSTQVQLQASANFGANDLAGATVLVMAGNGNGKGQSRVIISNTAGAGGNITVEAFNTLPVTPTYKIFASPPSTAASLTAIENTVWDAVSANHVTAGTTGKKLSDAGAAGDPWSTAVPGSYNAGTAGSIMGLMNGRVANLPNAVAGAAGGLVIAGVNANITANITGSVSGSVGSVTGAVASVTGNVSADVVKWGGAVVATPATAGVPDVNVKNFGNTAVTGRDIGASVLLSSGTGTGQVQLSGGNVTQVTNVGVVTGNVAAVTGNIGGLVVGSVASVVGAVGSVTANVSADVVKISGSVAAADNLEESTEAIAYGTVDGTGATTTAFVAATLTPASAVNDQFNGRVLIFKNDTTTTALRGQATTISDWVHGTLTFTVLALTTAPQTGDSFTIV